MDLRAHHKPTFDNISAEKRSRILDAATNEFAVKGFENGNINVLSMLVATGLCPSRGEARRLVQQGGVMVDDVKVASIDESLARERFEGEGIIVRKGKKVYHRVKV